MFWQTVCILVNCVRPMIIWVMIKLTYLVWEVFISDEFYFMTDNYNKWRKIIGGFIKSFCYVVTLKIPTIRKDIIPFILIHSDVPIVNCFNMWCTASNWVWRNMTFKRNIWIVCVCVRACVCMCAIC